MKRFTAIIFSALIICTAAGCSGSSGAGDNGNNTSSLSSQSVTESTPDAASSEVSGEVSVSDESSAEESGLQEKVSELMDTYGFEGVLYAEKDGKAVISYVDGDNEDGGDYTIDTPMPIGSTSKQFCAAAIMLLQEQGKLSIEDTLDKYYPEYAEGSKVTLKDLLSMRSDIINYDSTLYNEASVDKSYEENTEIIKKWIFRSSRNISPDKSFSYSNSNYFLLADIIESVTGERYIDFLRKSFFEPLGMTHTGSIEEMINGADWTGGVSYKKVDLQPGLTKGAGDIIMNAGDAVLWMNGLTGGKVVSAESYKAMTTNYSEPGNYGYGLYIDFHGGIGHPGAINSYTAVDYMNTDDGITLFFSSDTVPINEGMNMLDELVSAIKEE